MTKYTGLMIVVLGCLAGAAHGEHAAGGGAGTGSGKVERARAGVSAANTGAELGDVLSPAVFDKLEPLADKGFNVSKVECGGPRWSGPFTSPEGIPKHVPPFIIKGKQCLVTVSKKGEEDKKVLVSVNGHITVILPDRDVPIGLIRPGEEIRVWRNGLTYGAMLRRDWERAQLGAGDIGPRPI